MLLRSRPCKRGSCTGPLPSLLFSPRIHNYRNRIPGECPEKSFSYCVNSWRMPSEGPFAAFCAPPRIIEKIPDFGVSRVVDTLVTPYGTVLTGPAGRTGTDPIQVHVDGYGTPVPNVSVRILNPDVKNIGIQDAHGNIGHRRSVAINVNLDGIGAGAAGRPRQHRPIRSNERVNDARHTEIRECLGFRKNDTDAIDRGAN